MSKSASMKNTKKVTGSKPAATWAEMKDAKYNPRRIKPDTLDALRKSLLTFGDISGAVYNRRSGNLVCGHQRRKALAGLNVSTIEWGEAHTVMLGDGEIYDKFKSVEREGTIILPSGARIRIREVDWPEIFEKAANIAANNYHLNGQFTDDVSKLLDEIKLDMPKLSPALKMDELMIDSAVFDQAKEDVPEDEFKDKIKTEIQFNREGIIFTGNNPFNFPDLREDMLGNRICKTTWAGGRELAPSNESLFLYAVNASQWPDDMNLGLIGFYVTDERFNSIWTDPIVSADKLVERGITQILSPDFSMWINQPIIVQMHAHFRALWCARYWQERGIKIVPSLNWSSEASYEWAFMGLPHRCPVVYTQCRSGLNEKEDRARYITGLLAGIKWTNPDHVCIYGAENKEWIERNLPRKIDYTWIPSWTALRPAFRKRQGREAWAAGDDIHTSVDAGVRSTGRGKAGVSQVACAAGPTPQQ